MTDYIDKINQYISMEKAVLDSLDKGEINDVMNVLEKLIRICYPS